MRFPFGRFSTTSLFAAAMLVAQTDCFQVSGTATAQADDWPQWLGPQRDSMYRETGVRTSIPAGGLKVRWRVPVAGGYSGPAVAQGRVFVTDYVRTAGDPSNDPGARRELEGTERLHCLNVATGETLWTDEYARSYKVSYPAGPRATPTVDGDRVYSLGAEGDLRCLKVDTGELVWERNVQEDYKTTSPIWGYCAAPLVDGDRLICMVGGEGSTVVAFNKHTGAELWKGLTATDCGYCPPSIIQAGGVRQLIIWDPQALHGLNPETGEEYWSVPIEAAYGMSVAIPQQIGKFLFASSHGDIAVLLELADDRPAVKEVWRDGGPKLGLYSANVTPIADGNVVYGCDSKVGALMAVDLTTRERLWQTFAPTTGDRRGGHGTAFMVKHEDRYWLFSEKGDLILARLTPAAYEELGRFHVLDPTGECFGRDVSWAHPAFADRAVFARNDRELVCVSIAATDE